MGFLPVDHFSLFLVITKLSPCGVPPSYISRFILASTYSPLLNIAKLFSKEQLASYSSVHWFPSFHTHGTLSYFKDYCISFQPMYVKSIIS